MKLEVVHLPKVKPPVKDGTPFTTCGMTWPPKNWPLGHGWVTTPANAPAASEKVKHCECCFKSILS